MPCSMRRKLPLRQIMELKVGDTLPLEIRPDAQITVRCGDILLTEGRMGRVGDRISVRVSKPSAQAENDLRHVRKCRRFKKAPGGTVSYNIGLMIESLVAVLLLLTILYCARLNKQIGQLKAGRKADEGQHRRAGDGDRES